MKTETAILLGFSLLAPCAVLAVRVIGIQPRGAEATTQANTATPGSRETIGSVAWSAELNRVWLHATTLSTQPQQAVTPPEDPKDPIPEQVQPSMQIMLTPDLEMTGLYGAGGRSAAMINEKIVRLGTQAVPGWELVLTDPAARTATLEHADGRRLVLLLNED